MHDMYSLCVTASQQLNQTLIIEQVSGTYVLYRVETDGTSTPLVQTPTRKRMCDHLLRMIRSAEKKRLNVELPKSLHEQFAMSCKLNNLSVTEVIQDLILNHLYKA